MQGTKGNKLLAKQALKTNAKRAAGGRKGGAKGGMGGSKAAGQAQTKLAKPL